MLPLLAGGTVPNLQYVCTTTLQATLPFLACSTIRKSIVRLQQVASDTIACVQHNPSTAVYLQQAHLLLVCNIRGCPCF